MTRRAVILPLLLAFGTPLGVFAADEPAKPPSTRTPRSISAVATPSQVRLGEPFTLTIEVRDNAEFRYELPAALSLGKEFDVVRVSPGRSSEGGDTVTRFDIQALLFDLGEKTVADIALTATGPQGSSSLLVKGPKVTGVGDIKEDDEKAELQDILPPVDVVVPRYTALWIAGATLLTAIAALLVWQYLKGRPKKEKAVAAPPSAPAHERALAALAALQSEDLPARGLAKEHYFRLSEILRDYLGERFGFLALDMTTHELLATLARKPTPGLDYARFEVFCREGDLVKFAKQAATLTACKQAIEDAYGFVRATAPRLDPPGTSHGAAAS